jgi:outer membrane protein assembly factor BamB
MPQLEIHHADGNVTYSELSQQKPVMVGSGQNCDVVLTDPSVKRVHCRIVWRADKGEWRVEVAADAGGVTLGGRSVKAGSLRSGDVVGIGNCRLYMDDAGAAARPASLSEEIESQIHGTPATIDDESAEPVQLDRGSIRKKAHLVDNRGFWAKFTEGFKKKAKEQLQGEVDRPPGQERILGSPLVRWMGLALLVIVVLGLLAFYDYRRRAIIGLFEAAQQAQTAGNYEVAMKRFTEFVDTYPRHALASNAKVQRALCEVESNVGSSPSAALADARKMLREQSKEPGFAPQKDKITEVIGKIAQNLAESARANADRKSLEQSQEAQELINRELQGTKLSSEADAKLAQTQEAALAAITKFEELGKTLQTMDIAIQERKTFDAYAARERIVMLYGDFATKAEIVERMEQTHKLDLEAIQWEPLGKAAETQPRTGAVEASTLLVDLKGGAAAAATAGDANVAFLLASGGLSAHDGDSGKVLWSMAVGRDTNVLPISITPPGAPDEPMVLVSDSRHDELVAVQTKTGKVVWRQPLGEPLEAAPLLHRNKIYQPGGKGSLFVIDPKTGRIDGRLNFGEQRLTTTPAADLSGTHLFLLGEQYLLYVITLGGVPKCEDIYYTAHRPDSIIASPLRMLRYLVLCENSTANTVRMRVFLLKVDGTMDQEMQRLPPEGQPPINGWIHHQPAVFGNLMFVATDLENVYVYSGGPPERADGFTPVPVKTAGGGTFPPGTRPQAYPMYYNEKNLLVSGSMVRHFDYAAEQQSLTPSKDPGERLPGAASQPIQRDPAAGGRVDSLYVGRRIPGSSGIALTGLDAKNLETKWEALLGSGVLAIQPADASKNTWVVLTRGGLVYSVPAATLAAGGVIDKPIGRIEIEGELSDKTEPIVFPDGTSVYTPNGTPNRLFVRGSGTDAQIRPVDLLAPLRTPVVQFEDGMLIPATDGRIYWMSPAGKQLADPFQPPIAAEKPPEWRGVALTSKKTIVAVDSLGNFYQVVPQKGASPNLAERGVNKFPKPIRSGIATSGDLLGCVDDANVFHIWDAEALAAVSEIKLSSPASLGPVAASGHLFVAAGDDELVCVNPQGKEIWRHPLKGQNVVGRPLVKADAVHFVMASGLVRALRLADGGELWTLDTEKSLSGGPIDVDGKLVVIGDDGSLNVVKVSGGK